MLLLRASAVRWVCDDSQPGLVQVEITDADGRVHGFVEKSTVVDGALHTDARYPVGIQIACLPLHQEFRPREGRVINVVDLSPWGVGDPGVPIPVQRDQLSWVAPAIYSDLSVRARQAVALVSFRRWREFAGLASDSLTTLEDHLWQYAAVTGETFNAWYESHPLVRLGPDQPLPSDVQRSVAVCDLREDDVRQAVAALIAITYGGLFGRIESPWSLGELESLGRILAGSGVPLVPADDFAQSLWIDNDWGRPDAETVSLWRATK